MNSDPAPHPLVARAFEQARQRSKTPETPVTMTTAVLKNRMLQIDKNQANEVFAGQRFHKWLESQPGIIIDDSTRPNLVSLKDKTLITPGNVEGGDSQGASTTPMNRRRRIRPDLWSAMMPRNDGREFFWDKESELLIGEQSRSHVSPALPTLSQWEMDALKSKFADENPNEPLSEFRNNARVRQPPHPLRGAWNELLKKEVVSRLENWLSEQGVDAPSVLFETGSASHGASSEPSDRQAMLHMLDSLSTDALAEILVPLGLVLKHVRG